MVIEDAELYFLECLFTLNVLMPVVLSIKKEIKMLVSNTISVFVCIMHNIIYLSSVELSQENAKYKYIYIIIPFYIYILNIFLEFQNGWAEENMKFKFHC